MPHLRIMTAIDLPYVPAAAEGVRSPTTDPKRTYSAWGAPGRAPESAAAPAACVVGPERFELSTS